MELFCNKHDIPTFLVNYNAVMTLLVLLLSTKAYKAKLVTGLSKEKTLSCENIEYEKTTNHSTSASAPLEKTLKPNTYSEVSSFSSIHQNVASSMNGTLYPKWFSRKRRWIVHIAPVSKADTETTPTTNVYTSASGTETKQTHFFYHTNISRSNSQERRSVSKHGRGVKVVEEIRSNTPIPENNISYKQPKRQFDALQETIFSTEKRKLTIKLRGTIDNIETWSKFKEVTDEDTAKQTRNINNNKNFIDVIKLLNKINSSRIRPKRMLSTTTTETVGQALQGSTEAESTEAGIISVPRLPKRTLICTVSKFATKSANYPTEFCDFIIYLATFYIFETGEFRSVLDDAGLAQFFDMSKNANLSAENSRTGYLVSLGSAFFSENTINSLTSKSINLMKKFLKLHNLQGVSFVHQFLDDSNVETYLDILKLFHPLLSSGFAIILGYSTPQNTDTLVKALLQLSSMVTCTIVESHVKVIMDPCIAVFPNTYHSIDDGPSLSWAVDLKQTLQNEITIPICFSLSLRVLKYKVSFDVNSPGQPCEMMSSTSFLEICKRNNNFRYYSFAMSSGLSYKEHLYLFDSVKTLQTKMDMLLKDSGELCLMLDGVDFEDSGKTCGTTLLVAFKLLLSSCACN